MFKTILFASVILGIFTSSGYLKAESSLRIARQKSHLLPDLEASGAEYNRLLSERPKLQVLGRNKLQPALDLGKRNLDWLNFINSQRPDKISLTQRGALHGTPIEDTKEYNESTIFRSFVDLLPQLPSSMKSVLVDGNAFTADPGVSLETYVIWARKVDLVYQMSARWQLLEPNLGWMTGLKARDVRGFYFLKKETQLEDNLKNFEKLPAQTQAQYQVWLAMVCGNSQVREDRCKQQLVDSIKANSVIDYYRRYWAQAEKNWQAFFEIPRGYRFDPVKWSNANPNFLFVPFQHSNPTIDAFLEKNIQEEWRWTNFQLVTDFSWRTSDGVETEFVPGAVPHVNGLGSNVMVMDANAPLSEWEVQWTIRHEFGHVLAFPDCYLEFYDQVKGVVVSYQLDVDDLMCSRRGKFQARHFDELKKTYFPTR